MYFIDQRIQVICNQLKLLRFTHSHGLSNWEYKPGFFLHPEDADAMEKALTEVLGYPPAGRAQISAAIAINAGPRVVGVGFRGK